MYVCDTDSCNSAEADITKNNLITNPPFTWCYQFATDTEQKVTQIGKQRLVERNPGDVSCFRMVLNCKGNECETKFKDAKFPPEFLFNLKTYSAYSEEYAGGALEAEIKSLPEFSTAYKDVVKEFMSCKGKPFLMNNN